VASLNIRWRRAPYLCVGHNRKGHHHANNFDVLRILIRMFFYDTDKHYVPHIHAEYQGQVAVYSILDGAVLAGELPPRKHKLVVAWIEIHQDDLLADWQLAVNGKKPFPIRGLDQ
jgi:hypothetical protein